MRIRTAIVILFVLSTLGSQQAPLPAAEELLTRSINHHDPEGVWNSSIFRLATSWSLPDGQPDGNESWIVIDNLNGSLTKFTTRADGTEIRTYVRGSECVAHVNGQPATKEQEEEYFLDCTTLMWGRDTTLYLIGVPMKLRDRGTIVHPTTSRTTFMGHEVFAIDVTYEPEVGDVNWRFYFDPDTAALVGFRFHRESADDGEHVALEGEVVAGTLRIPKTRRWYVSGEDALGGIKTLRATHR